MSNLAKAIDGRGLKQLWLAEQLGVTPATLSNWVTDKTMPSVNDAVRISELLEVPVDELWPQSDEKTND
ncbi:hypothetical protein LCGC14_1645760 [marine sediment metagenome]|uniref:HTH cro/C1-type domain-containing protein n=1 Tax=marine sediment metagenome TaxID=412755 RepID=A0A0F9KE48_9ZZZZ